MIVDELRPVFAKKSDRYLQVSSHAKELDCCARL
jgi:hypothetical protein